MFFKSLFVRDDAMTKKDALALIKNSNAPDYVKEAYYIHDADPTVGSQIKLDQAIQRYKEENAFAKKVDALIPEHLRSKNLDELPENLQVAISSCMIFRDQRRLDHLRQVVENLQNV